MSDLTERTLTEADDEILEGGNSSITLASTNRGSSAADQTVWPADGAAARGGRN